MNFTIKLYSYWVSIFLIFFLGVISIIFLFWGLNVSFWQAVLVFVIVGMIPPAIMTFYYSKRLNYMESDNIEPPQFEGQKKATFLIKKNNKSSFDEVLQRIDRQWIISYSDRKSGVLKFRTDARMTSWGLGGYIKMEEEDKVLVIIYPIHPNSPREKKMVVQTLRIMRTIF